MPAQPLIPVTEERRTGRSLETYSLNGSTAESARTRRRCSPGRTKASRFPMLSPGDSSLRKTKRKPPSKPLGGRWHCETRHLRSHHRAVHRAVETRNRCLAEALPDLDLGGHVKKGEKSTPVIYYKILEKRDDAGNMMVREDGRPARIPFVRMSSISTRPKASRHPRSRRARTLRSRTKRRLPSWRMPGSAPSIMGDLPPSTHARMSDPHPGSDDLSQSGGLLPHPLSRNDSCHRPRLKAGSRRHYPAREIRLRPLFQGRVGRRTRCGIPLKRSGNSRWRPVRELGGLPRFMGIEV